LGSERFFSIERELPSCQVTNNLTEEINNHEYRIFTQIFYYNYHHNYYFPDLDNQNSTDIKLTTIPGQCGIYKLQMEVNEKNYNVETNKINRSNKSIREFIFSPTLNLYIEEKTAKSK